LEALMQPLDMELFVLISHHEAMLGRCVRSQKMAGIGSSGGSAAHDLAVAQQPLLCVVDKEF
jgi:hypothetical protein